MKTLICLGGGIEAIPIIQRVRELGFRAVIVDGDRNAPASHLGYFIDASCYHASEAIPVLRASGIQFDGVMCAAVDAPVACAGVAAEFGLPGLNVEAAHLGQDKLKQVFTLWDVVSHPDKASAEIVTGEIHIPSWAGIIKPVDSRGGRGVIRLLLGIDPSWAYEQACAASPTGRVMVEEWLDGPQLSTESIIQDGRVLFTAIGLRNYARLDEFAPYVIEDGFDEPYPDHAWYAGGKHNLDYDIDSIIESACRALGWYQSGAGIIKGDLVIHDSRIYVIELAARLSGGFFASHGHPLAYGIDFVGAAIKAALGYTLEEPKPYARVFVSQRYVFPSPEDIGKTVVSRPNTMDAQFIVQTPFDVATWNIKLGDVVKPVTCHPARWGQALATGGTPDEAQRRAETAVAEMKRGVVLA